MKTHGIRTAVISILLFFSYSIAAEDLMDIYLEAIKADPTLAAAQADYEASLQAKPQARAAFLPQINANAAYQDTDQQYKNAASFFSDSKFNTTTYGIQLDQALFNKSRWTQLAQADTTVARSAAELSVAQQDLILRVAQNYFDVLNSQDTLAFAEAEKDAIYQQLQQTQQQFDVGLIAITDVHESQAQYDLAKTREINARNQLDISKEALHAIINYPTEGLSILRENTPMPYPEPNDIQAWVDTSLETNPQLIAVDQSVVLAAQEVSRRKGGHYPTLGLSATYGINDSDGGFSEGEVTDTTIGVQFNLPIYVGGLTSAQVSEARSLHKKALMEQERAKRDLVQQTRASYSNVVAGISSVEALKQALKSTKTAADAAQVGFEVGTRTAVDVLLALRETYRARRDYSEARYNYILSMLQLKQAAGSVNEEDLKAINSWLH